MISFLYGTLGFLFIIGVSVFVHELGHFIAAKLFKVNIPVFSIGFGHRLFGFKIKETDYRISLIPLGGYVKMEGENPEEKVADKRGSFAEKPIWQRFVIAIAGVTMNVILAILVLTFLYNHGHEYPTFQNEQPVIGYVLKDSAAEKAGLEKSAQIISVNNKPAKTWTGTLNEIILSGNTAELEIRQNKNVFKTSISFSLENLERLGAWNILGIYPSELIHISGVLKDSPAQFAGLKEGDLILTINNNPILSQVETVMMIMDSNGKEMIITILRDNEEKNISVTPRLQSDRWNIGIEFAANVTSESLPLPEAFRASVTKNVEFTQIMFTSFQRIAEGKIKAKNVMGGPIQIAKISGRVAQTGFINLLFLLAMININLAIINLLPIPVLDGGVIMFLAVEKIMGRKLSKITAQRIQTIGAMIVILLIIFTLFIDIEKLFK